MKAAVASLIAVGACVALTSCSTTEPTATQPAGNSTASASPTGAAAPLSIVAESSTQAALTQLAAAWEKKNPAAKITVTAASGPALATRVAPGTPVDLVVLNNPKALADIAATRPLSPGKTFGVTTMHVAVNPAKPVTSLLELKQPGLKIAACDMSAPCGGAASAMQAKARIQFKPSVSAPDSPGVIAKVTSGEADAGLVYTSDCIAAKDAVKCLEIPAEINVASEAQVATTTDSKNAPTATAFIDFLLSDEGQKILETAGFKRP